MSNAQPRLAILDRDGVINRDSDQFVRSVAEWQPIGGSIAAIARLALAGFVVTVASNQSGIGRGYFTRETVYAMHRKMRRLVRRAGGNIAAVAICPHRPDEGCACRKPGTELYRRLAARTGLELAGALVVGDSYRDLAAGAAVDADLWLVRTGKGQRAIEEGERRAPAWWRSVRIRDDLAQIAREVTG